MDTENTGVSTITTIKLSKETKQRLERLRSHKRESYDEILQKILGILNTLRANPESAVRNLSLIDSQNRKTR